VTSPPHRPPVAPADRPKSTPQGDWTERITPERFAGKTVIVTGAGSGIGRATASRVAREGGRVIAVDVSDSGLKDLAQESAAFDVVTALADVTDESAVQEVASLAGPDVFGLANIAGIMDTMTPLHEVTDEEWSRVMAVNVEGMMRLSRAVLPRMLAHATGSIVNVGSEASFKGSVAGAAYVTSKHAVVGLTRSMAFMYGGQGIRVNAVAPGAVATNIRADFASAMGSARVAPILSTLPSVATAEHLAASITFLLSEDAVNINGAVIPSDGGWSVQ
jgi:NAD(P)-dependent dehydrogenase (short-subunit alcohol dehydrogenase family)